ncbi:MAG: ERF family protein, partial [Pseudoflavonifractor sp.]
QVTGAASSYARKYALNGLFLIDDAKDSDGTNDHGKDTPSPKSTVTIPCEDCGSIIHSITKRDGTPWSASDIVLYSEKRFGRKLCPDCQKRVFSDEKETQP